MNFNLKEIYSAFMVLFTVLDIVGNYNNPLGAIIKNVRSSVFFSVKRKKKCIANHF
ncbi:hypothetical protein [Polaribacter sp.]|jgi:hypothetical protein|uniref:hypothetical protein n=1 Tax=Polaribacter sp. TaxID=1920175 RepID=UPI0040481C86